MNFVILLFSVLISTSLFHAYEIDDNLHPREYYEDKFQKYLEARPYLKPKDSAEYLHWLNNFANNDGKMIYTLFYHLIS